MEARFDEYADDMACEAVMLLWHVADGDAVAEEGQELREIGSVTALSVVTSPCSGLVETILCPGTATVTPGCLLATIRPVWGHGSHRSAVKSATGAPPSPRRLPS